MKKAFYEIVLFALFWILVIVILLIGGCGKEDVNPDSNGLIGNTFRWECFDDPYHYLIHFTEDSVKSRWALGVNSNVDTTGTEHSDYDHKENFKVDYTDDALMIHRTDYIEPIKYRLENDTLILHTSEEIEEQYYIKDNSFNYLF